MAEQGFTLTSPQFAPDASLPAALTCDGENQSPALKWIHPPQGTQSYLLIVDDPDAPHGTFTHWVLFDIPADLRELPAKASGIGRSGGNDFQHVGYGGPLPTSQSRPASLLLQVVCTRYRLLTGRGKRSMGRD